MWLQGSSYHHWVTVAKSRLNEFLCNGSTTTKKEGVQAVADKLFYKIIVQLLYGLYCFQPFYSIILYYIILYSILSDYRRLPQSLHTPTKARHGSWPWSSERCPIIGCLAPPHGGKMAVHGPVHDPVHGPCMARLWPVHGQQVLFEYELTVEVPHAPFVMPYI